MAYETIIVDNKDFVTTITLNRPERLNALNLQLANELFDALHEKDQDDDTRVFIITGAGRGFSSGADQRGGGTSEPKASNAPALPSACSSVSTTWRNPSSPRSTAGPSAAAAP